MIYRNLLLFSCLSEQVLSIVLGEELSLFHIIKISEWILGIRLRIEALGEGSAQKSLLTHFFSDRTLREGKGKGCKKVGKSFPREGEENRKRQQRTPK